MKQPIRWNRVFKLVKHSLIMAYYDNDKDRFICLANRGNALLKYANKPTALAKDLWNNIDRVRAI